MRAYKSSDGYTVIEITLFLALSGLLLTVAFMGVSTTIRNMRFSDSTRSLHSFLQKQYDDILNGVNTREGAEACQNSQVVTTSSDKPGASRCLLLGKFITFSRGNSTVNVYPIVGSEPPGGASSTATDQQLIVDYNPAVVRNTQQQQSYTIPWLAPVTAMVRKSDSAAVNSYALIRSPRSSRVLSYTFQDPGGASIRTQVNDPSSQAKETNICVKNADSIGGPAKIIVGKGQGQDSIQLIYDIDEATECREGP